MVAALPLIRSEKKETVMQSSIISPRISPVRNRERSIGPRREKVHELRRKLDRASRWGDEVATISLALLLVIVFALVFEAIVV
jgi:hypothetical protein